MSTKPLNKGKVRISWLFRKGKGMKHSVKISVSKKGNSTSQVIYLDGMPIKGVKSYNIKSTELGTVLTIDLMIDPKNLSVGLKDIPDEFSS